jgi:protein TonB
MNFKFLSLFKDKKILKAFGSSIFGVLLVLGGLLMMNGLEGLKRDRNDKHVTSFSLKPKTKKKQKKTLAKKKVVKQRRSRPKVAAPKLSGSLTGSSFGLGQFEFLGESGAGLLGDSSNVIMTEDTVDDVPKARYRPPLDYPSFARKRSIEGFVVLNMLIGTGGNVEAVKLLSAEPQGIFDLVAMESAKEWQFDAAKYQGKKVKVWVRQRIAFNLN